MITIVEKSNCITTTYDIRIAIRNFNIQNVIRIQRDNRYVCNTCERIFNRKSIKTKHLLFHISSQIWKCEYCNRFFRRQNHLDRHLSIHRKANMQSKVIIFNKTIYISNVDVFVSQLYLKHIVFQKLLHDFRTNYNRRFFRTSCSFCDILMFLDETKWSVFDNNVKYDFFLIFRQFLHYKFDENEQRFVFVCDVCQKHSRLMFQIKFWFDEIMSFFHRFRIFLFLLKLMTNLRKIQNVDDVRSNWTIYKIVSNKSS